MAIILNIFTAYYLIKITNYFTPILLLKLKNKIAESYILEKYMTMKDIKNKQKMEKEDELWHL